MRTHDCRSARVYLQVVALGIWCAVFFAVVPLPRAYYQSLPLPRIQELVPAALFLIALVGYLVQGRWKRRPLERWLVPSILVGLMVQLPFMASSRQLYDAAFTTAHVLKIVSYALVLVGLLASMYGLFVQYEQSVREARRANRALRREVLERSRVETALRHSEEKYRTILETIREGYFEVDQAGRLAFFNPSFAQFVGYPPDRLQQVDPRSFTDQENATILQEAFQRLRMTGEPIEPLGFEIIRADGARRFVEASMIPIRDGRGAIVGARGMARDITERRLAERELARSHAELQQFAYVASHDLQEPLRMVAGYTRLLARRYLGKLDDEADEFIQFIVDGVTRMQALINDLLQYSRIESHGTSFEPVPSATALEWALSNLEAAIKESGATVEASHLPTVNADPTQLGQLFQNLIGNGIKFREERPPEVRVEARHNGREWVFSVSDNGIGIEPQYRERVFEIFQRLHTQEHYDGTGIGLAICRRIVERHGGRIWVESAPGLGSSFHFTIPDGAIDARRASA